MRRRCDQFQAQQFCEPVDRVSSDVRDDVGEPGCSCARSGRRIAAGTSKKRWRKKSRATLWIARVAMSFIGRPQHVAIVVKYFLNAGIVDGLAQLPIA